MVKKWQIYFCNLDPVIGSEQRGYRPVLVISNNSVNKYIPICTVIPISSIKQGSKIYPTEVILPMDKSGLPKPSVAMIQQIRTISQERLSKYISEISDSDIQKEIVDGLKKYFEL